MKEIINKNVLFKTSILAILLISVTFSSCENEDRYLNKDEKYNAINELASQYNLDIKIKDGIDEKNINLNSLSDLEDIFEKLSNERQRIHTKKISLKKNSTNTFVYRSNSSKKDKKRLRLKTDGIEDDENIENLSDWFYDLTWFNASIKFDKDSDGNITNVKVNSSYSGVSLYKYTQTNSAVRIEGSKIFFETQGAESADFNILGVTVTESRQINTTGFIDTNTGEGEINLGGNGYWSN